MYEKSNLDTIALEFSELLERDPEEEEVQKYIEEHPVLLAQFSPLRIRYKSPILSRFKTDITVLSETGGLVLIELEKPSKRLLTKGGDETQHLQHALRQVRDWLHEVQEHRLATLDCLEMKSPEVRSVSALVIVGRDKDHDPERLRRLKSVDHGRYVQVLTYDDLLSGFVAVARSIGSA